MSELTGSNHRCRAQFKCAQTVIGQRSAGKGPNGLSYDYYYMVGWLSGVKVALCIITMTVWTAQQCEKDKKKFRALVSMYVH